MVVKNIHVEYFLKCMYSITIWQSYSHKHN